ncbi:MAG: type IX secretion system sortase PorU [Bacteroidales bacterium]|nr:type IX secretion system sortase PorU [Bacteroidales bacterium]
MHKLSFSILSLLLVLVPNIGRAAHTWSEHSALSEGTWVKISLDEGKDGIYAITYSQLRNWGFSDPSRVGVYGYGGHTLGEAFSSQHIDDVPEVAAVHDDANQRILFYGRGLIEWTYNTSNGFVQRQHPYAKTACYFLHQKSDEAPLLPETLESNTAATVSDTLSEYDEYWLHELESVNIGETGRWWYGENFLTTSSQPFTLPEESWLSGHTLKYGTARIAVGFMTQSASSSTIKIQLDGTEIGTQTISATTSTYAFGNEATYREELDTTADMTGARVRITYSNGTATASKARLNYIRLQGKCDLQASSKEAFMLFRNSEALSKLKAYRIGGLNSNMQVWDITSPTDIRIQQFNAGIDSEGNAVFVPQETGIREYAVVNLASNAFLGVSRVGTVSNQDLHSLKPANLVILTPTGLYQYARQLAEHRASHDGLSYHIVTPTEIYNEYSSGVPDVTAIRLFLKQLYDRADGGSNDLLYFLLFGDGTYDNFAATQSNYLLPTYQTETSLAETSSTTVDDYFGFLDDSDGGRTSNGYYYLNSEGLDIGVGRLAISSAEQAEAVVNKLIAYDKANQLGNWKNRLCFLSDDDKMDASGTDSPNLHIRHNERLISSLLSQGHEEFVYQKIYLPAYSQSTSSSGTDYPDARKELNNALQQGCLMLNYAGHGSTQSITHESLMNASLASQLNMKHFPLWITASCSVSRYDADDISMGEALLLNPNGGAIGLISTTRVVYAGDNLSLNQAFINHLFDRHEDGTRYRLGDILRVAKRQIGNNYNKLNFCLLGDPSMTLAFPEHEMVVDSVSGTWQTLSTVTVSGHICKLGSTEIDSTFNGLIYPTVYDAEDSITADKGIYQEPVMTFASRTRKVFTGRDWVKNGIFQFSFKVPQDILYSQSTGLINLYACSDEGAEGQGYYNQFTLSAGAAPTETDTVPPVIVACFLDDDSFRSGDKVGLTPFFYAEVTDSSGINATGNSIGHDVCLYIECLSNPLQTNRQYVLNNYFTTFTGDATHGNVKYSIDDLEEGTYRATFRVWDVYNNVSSRTFTFTVSNRKKATIALLQAYPSPVRQGETVTFRVLHNRPESAEELRLQVFTQTGVKVLDTTASSSSSEVVYLKEGATELTELNSALNADETSALMGSTAIQWSATLVPGVYVYKAYLTAGSEETATDSKLLIVY